MSNVFAMSNVYMSVNKNNNNHSLASAQNVI